MDWRNGLITLSTICFAPLSSVHAAGSPLFSIIATTPSTIQVPSSGQGAVSYLVTNNTHAAQTLTLAPVTGVNQVVAGASSCSSPTFTLRSRQSCLLNLSINGSLIPASGIQSGPTICKTKGSGNDAPDFFFCSQASALNRLNLTIVSTPVYRVAVGRGINGSGVGVPIAYLSNDGGASWSAPTIQPEMPAGATSNVLRSVACSNSGLICSAVGSTTITGIQYPLSYQSNDGGLHWSAPILPLRPGSNTGNLLASVSCSSSGSLCTAVGVTRNSGNNNPLIYYSTDGGANWQAPASLPSLIGTRSLLNGVSCSSSGSRCVAVGQSFNIGVFSPLSYFSTDGGQNWSASSAQPVPRSAQSSGLYGVSCSADGLTCLAVGETFDNDGYLSALTYTSTDGGASWGDPVVPPPANGIRENSLLGVNCSDSGLLCSAVGYTYDGSTSGNLSYTSSNGGATWSNPVLPAGPGVSATDTMNGVFCDSNGVFCTAVGSGDAQMYSYLSNNSGLNWSNLLVFPTQGFTAPTAGGVSGNR